MKLKELYDQIELSSTDDRVLLSKVQGRSASRDEINDLLDRIRSSGGKLLDTIKDYENALIESINEQIESLIKMKAESDELLYCENEKELKLKKNDMKKRYKNHVAKSYEILEEIKIAYFQIPDFTQYEKKLYCAKEPLSYLE